MSVFVCDSGSLQHCRVVRVLYAVSLSLFGLVETWVAVPQQNEKKEELLFCGEEEFSQESGNA